MRSTRLRFRWVLSAAAVASAGMVFQTACMSFAGNQVLHALDFCFLFDCQNGAFGGLIDPCPDQATTDSSGSSSTDTVTRANIFVDCPTVDTTSG